jgi:pimeloyl-ACP methyl ester carboxylesterase
MSMAIRMRWTRLEAMQAATALHPDTRTRDRYGPGKRSPWLDVDWREHQRWVSVEGRPINVIELGSGPPLLFIHGLAGSWQNWLEQMPVFAAERRVIAIDLPGFGDSPMPRDTISIGGYARIVDALLQALDVSATAVVGNSMGGFIAAELAIAYPQRVERLALVSAAGISSERLALARAIPAMRRAERGLLMATGWVAARSDAVARRPRLRQAALAVVVAHPTCVPSPLAAAVLRGSGKPGFIDAFYALTHYPIRERLPEIAAPTLIVWGERDHLVPLRDAHVFERLIPSARKTVYPDTGHVPMLERPNRFNADLRAFLDD